ncbi:MAG: hypothetical protein N2556_06865 [Anaerolineae bacterium]|nr:hypothetical protein [Anaerolineae bacterium]
MKGQRFRTLLVALSLVAIWWVAFSFSLRLPLFSDDIPHFQWVEEQTLLSVLVSTLPGVGFYRPINFFLWKLTRVLQGEFHAPTLHGISITLHLFNVFLLRALVSRQVRGEGWLVGGAAALLFLLYPFSYQTVPWVVPTTHLLVVASVLGSLLLFRVAESCSSRFLKAFSTLLAFLAPLAHETGVLTAPFLSLLLWTGEERPSLSGVLRRTRFHWLAGLLGLAVWLAAPKGTQPMHIWNLEARYQNGVYALQGLAYPVAPLAKRVWNAGWGLDDLQSVLLVCGVAVALWSWLLWKTGRRQLLTLALGWFLLGVAPAWLIVDFRYMIDGPRLLYLSSVGTALFWAAPLWGWEESFRGRLGRIAAGVLVLLVALCGFVFIRQRAAIYEEMGRWIAQFVQGVRSVSAPGPVLCVNCPEFLAPRESTFAVGHEGVPICAGHQLGGLFWVNTGEEREVVGLVFPDVQRPWKYHYGSAGEAHTWISLQEVLRGASGVLLTDYSEENIAIHPAGALEKEGVLPSGEFLAEFDGRIRLLSADIRQEGQNVKVELHWQAVAPLTEDSTVFLHVLDRSGQLVGQRDGYPLMGLSRPLAWHPGDLWQDLRWLQLPEGEYRFLVGLYTTEGGLRLPATDPTGHRFPDDAVPIGEFAFSPAPGGQNIRKESPLVVSANGGIIPPPFH